jgi:hypothetical protein
MTTKQARIHLGDVRWFVTSANGWVVRGPFDTREQVKDALADIRRLAYEEHDEELAEDDYYPWEGVA